MRTNAVLGLILVGLVLYGYRERQLVSQDTGAQTSAPEGEKLLPIPLAQVMALRFKAPSGWVVLNQAGIWGVEGIPEARVDTDAVTQLLSATEMARIIRTFECDPLKLAQYGLTTPSLVIGVRRRGEKEFHDLLLGDKNPGENAVYAKWTQTSQVLLIGAYFETVARMMVQRIREGKRAEEQSHRR